MEESLPTFAMTTYAASAVNSTEVSETFSWHVFEISFLSILSVFITFGNGLNIWILRSPHYVQSIHGCLLVSLAIADIGLGPTTAVAAVSAILQRQWYGDHLCFAIAFLGEIFRCVSLSMLTLLNLEKYFGILHPLRYSVVVTRRRTILVVCLLWATITAMYLLIYVASPDGFVHYDYVENMYTCLPKFRDEGTTGLIITLSLLTPSFVIITYTSIRIMLKIAIAAKRRRRLCPSCPQRKLSKFQKILPSSLRHNIKAFRVLLVISGMVYITWLPFTVCMVTSVLGGEHYSSSRARDFVSLWLAVSNSGFNIVIYYVMDTKYRLAFCTTIGKLYRKQDRSKEDTNGRRVGITLPSGQQRKSAGAGRKLTLDIFPSEGRRLYRIGIRDENGYITPTDVKVTSPPIDVTPRRRFLRYLYDDLNIHSNTGAGERAFLSFYSIPNGVSRRYSTRSSAARPNATRPHSNA